MVLHSSSICSLHRRQSQRVCGFALGWCCRGWVPVATVRTCRLAVSTTRQKTTHCISRG
jgi:hypothetical protein